MSRTASERRHRAAAVRRLPACSIEPLEGRQLFSAAPLGGGAIAAGHVEAAVISMRKSGGQAEIRSIIGVLRNAPLQADNPSIIAILKSLADGGTTAPAVKIIAI